MTPQRRFVRFGTVELDLHTGELRKKGIKGHRKTRTAMRGGAFFETDAALEAGRGVGRELAANR